MVGLKSLAPFGGAPGYAEIANKYQGIYYCPFFLDLQTGTKSERGNSNAYTKGACG